METKQLVVRWKEHIKIITLVLIICALIIGLMVLFVHPANAQIEPVVPKPTDKPVITYVPEDQIKWVQTGSNGDEIITIKQIDDRTWDFFITPDPARLKSAEIAAYPLEAFYLYSTDSLVSNKYKVPLSQDLVRFTELPKDDKTSPDVLSKTVSLVDNYGVRVYLPEPRTVMGQELYLKYGVHSATYSAVSNTIIVTGSPVTFNDLLLAGTGPVTSCGTRQYNFGCKIQVGDGVVPTHLVGTSCQVYFSDSVCVGNYENLFRVQTNAILTFDTSEVLDVSPSTYGGTIYDGGGIIRLTQSSLGAVKNNTNERFQIHGFDSPSYIRDCIFMQGEFYHSNTGLEITNTVINGGWAGVYQPLGSVVFDSVKMTRGRYNFVPRWGISSTLTNCILDDAELYNLYLWQTSATSTMVNCALDDWSSVTKLDPCTHGIERQHTLDLGVYHESGLPHLGAVCTLTDSGSTQVYNGVVSASGTIPTQALDYYWIMPDLGTKSFSPYTLQVQAVGYHDYQHKLDMYEQKCLEIVMCPIDTGTTAGDVLSWLSQNSATKSWWEENMDLLNNTILFLALALLSLWAYKRRIGWICVVGGISVMTAATGLVVESGATYGFPFVVLGIGVFVLGILNIRKFA